MSLPQRATNPPQEPIALLDLKRCLAQNPELGAKLTEAFVRVLSSGQYILGPEVAALEQELSALCQVPHAVGVSSGTDALLLALLAHGLGPGDDVLCPAYTFFATAGTIVRSGARPLFVDICPGCYNMHPAACAQTLTPHTRGLIAVHLFGQTAHMAPLLCLAQRHDLVLIEDAAQAIGAETAAGRRAGSLGHVGCFSFFPSKNLGAFGDAGLVTTHDPALAERLRILRVHGGAPKYYHSMVGGNFRLDALQAALLRVKLPYLHAATAARAAHAAQYQSLFAASGLAAAQECVCDGLLAGSPAAGSLVLGLPHTPTGRHVYNQYIIRVRGGRRDRVRAALLAQGIGTEVYYPVPMHLQPCFAGLGYRPGDLPHAEAAAQETLALPVYPELTSAQIDRVARAVLSACTQN